MDERVYMGISAAISAAIFGFCFYKLAVYIRNTKSKKLKIGYISFVIISSIVSIYINEFYVEDYNLYAYFIVKAYALSVPASIWSLEKRE